MNKWAQRIVLAGIAILCLADTALAQRGRGGGGRGGGGMRGGGGGFRGGGGGGFSSRGGARQSVTRPANRPGYGGGGISNRPGNINNRPGNINNRPGNINNINGGNVINNRPVNVRDVDVNGGWGGYGDWNDGCCFNHPVAAAAAIGTAAALTSAAIGSIVYTLPSSCSAVIVDGITYEQCGSTWYQPQFMGTETTYVVVSPP
jgi:hypothetical protein